MTTRCAICSESIADRETVFTVPRLPERYEFEDWEGQVHRRCIQDSERVQEFRSVLARSIAGSTSQSSNKRLAAVDGMVLRVDSNIYNEHTIWNLADFVEFTVIGEAVEGIVEARPGEDIQITARVKETLEVRPGGATRLVTPSRSKPMPSLSLQRLQELLSPSLRPEMSDVFAQIIDIDGPPPGLETLVGWVPNSSNDGPDPLLIQPFQSDDGRSGVLLTSIDPHVELWSETFPETMSVRIDQETVLEFANLERATEMSKTSSIHVDGEPSSSVRDAAA